MREVLRSNALTRFGVGVLQGAALYVLHRARESRGWPATEPLVFAPLASVAIFVPLIIVTGLGHLRPRTLVSWAGTSALLCASLAFYDLYRASPEDFNTIPFVQGPRILPSPGLWIALTAGLFITQSLIIAGDAEQRIVASYPRHFDESWKLGIQFVLGGVFVAAFWGLLWLCAELFRLIKIEFFYDLLGHSWFSIPVTALALTFALHITDVHASIVRGTRTLVLTLLSWLLPLITVMTVLFIGALLFTGLEPLWDTRHATAILLSVAAASIFLINAAYQDGAPEYRPLPVLRYASIAAAILLMPLVVLAAYGLWLRLQQYGWTGQRVTAAACIAVGACYAVGYVTAVVRSGMTLRHFETTNVVAAFVILGVLFALFTPLADPVRISVADQVRRLESGRTPVDDFDYGFLRFRSGRYGLAALEQLKRKTDGPEAARISLKANEALDGRTAPSQVRRDVRATPASRIANITVVAPKGHPLPESFVQQDWGLGRLPWGAPGCLVAATRCDAILADLDGDDVPEIILFSAPAGSNMVFKMADGRWSILGRFTSPYCSLVQESLRAGDFRIVPSSLKDIEVRGQRLRIDEPCR